MVTLSFLTRPCGEVLLSLAHTHAASGVCVGEHTSPNTHWGRQSNQSTRIPPVPARHAQLTFLYDKGAVLALVSKAVERLPRLSQAPSKRARYRTHLAKETNTAIAASLAALFAAVPLLFF